MPAFISTAWHEDWMSLRVFHKDTITMLQGRVEIEGKAINFPYGYVAVCCARDIFEYSIYEYRKKEASQLNCKVARPLRFPNKTSKKRRRNDPDTNAKKSR
jgi:hypothetical protein